MPIEADIPLEIDNYQKKIIFGLTLRQLVCLGLALLMAGGVFALFVLVLGQDSQDAGWLIMAAVSPALAVGFVRPDGAPFEQFLARGLRHRLWPSRLYYTAEPEPGQDTENRNTKRKGGIKHVSHPTARAAENTFRYRGAGGKGKRKQTARRVKAAKKEYRQAAARAKQASCAGRA